MSLHFHEAARAEFQEAAAYYEERQDGLGIDFIRRVKDASAAATREARRKRLTGVHRMRLARFPYQLVYHVGPAGLTIVAVMHLSRRPNYWHGRLRDVD